MPRSRPLRLAAALPLAVLLLWGCSKERSLVAHITISPGIPGDCAVLEMTAVGHPSAEKVIPRAGGQDELWVAVFQGDWPAEVSLEAFVPAGSCSPPFTRLARSPVQAATFSAAPGPPVELPVAASLSPVALAFAGALGPQESGACSPPLQLQVTSATGAPAPVPAAITATFSISPDTGLQVFADDLCATPVSAAEVGPGSSSIPLRVRGRGAGMTSLTASAAGLAPAQRSIEVVPGPPAELVVLSAPQTVLAGECSVPVVVRLQDAAGNPTTARADLPLDMALSAAGTSFHADALCTVPLGSATIATGSGQASATFRAASPGSATLTATAGGLPPATQGQEVRPIARRGSCVMPAGTTSASCPVSPAPLQRGRAFAFFQATVASASPSDGQVRCVLADPPVALECSRDGSQGDVAIAWSVVELAYASVQHATLNCGAVSSPYPPSRLTLQRPVDLGQAFLLHSVASIGGQYADDFRATRFVDATTVEFGNELTDCIPNWDYSVQAVELAGASVDRGTASTDAGAVAVSSLPAVNRGRTFLLYSWSTAIAGSDICDRMVMGEMDSDTSLRFVMGNGNAACVHQAATVAWERVQLPAGLVQSPAVSMNANVYTAAVSLSPAVNLGRTAVFSGGQAVGGQGDGQSAHTQSDMAAEAIARHELTGQATLRLTRDSADAGSRWRPSVVEFQP